MKLQEIKHIIETLIQEFEETKKAELIEILEKLGQPDIVKKISELGLPKKMFVSSDMFHFIKIYFNRYANIVEHKLLPKQCILFSWDENFLIDILKSTPLQMNVYKEEHE
jgi:hypothetical protein